MKKRLWLTLGGFLVVLIAIRIALEPITLHFVNKALSNLDGYEGKVQDIDIALYRGAYKIDSLIIEKNDGDFPEPFVSLPKIEISIEWDALFGGSIVGEIVMDHPQINFTINKKGENQSGKEANWLEMLDALVPIRINRFEIINGQINFTDLSSAPNIDIEIDDLQGVATNLSTIRDSNKKLPSRIEIRARSSGKGDLNLDMDLNLLKEIPDFDLNLGTEHIDLTYLNDFAEAYAKFTFERGTMDLFAEVAMEDGKYEGYIKPILREVEVLDLDDQTQSIWRKTWEVIVGTTMKIFQNQKEQQFATEVPFSGTTHNSDVEILPTIINVLKNAFIEAFEAQIDDKVDIDSVNDEKEKKGLFDFLKKDDDNK